MCVFPICRQFLWSFRLPGEAQKIDRMMECFAERYCELNPDVFTSSGETTAHDWRIEYMAFLAMLFDENLDLIYLKCLVFKGETPLLTIIKIVIGGVDWVESLFWVLDNPVFHNHYCETTTCNKYGDILHHRSAC